MAIEKLEKDYTFISKTLEVHTFTVLGLVGVSV
jgi:hypothetical protein